MKLLILHFIIISLCQGVIEENIATNNMGEKSNLPVIYKEKSYSEFQYDLEVDIKYVPLETSRDILWGRGAHIYYISDSLILVTNWWNGDVIFFNMNGRAVSHFNQKNGLGYNRIDYAVYDNDSKEVFIMDKVLRKIVVFTREGVLKRSFKMPKNLTFARIENFNSNLLLAWHEHAMGPLEPEQRNPYVLISKKNGNIVSKLNIYLEEANPRYLMSGNTCYTLGNSAMGNCKFGNEFYLNNMSMDTIFLLDHDKILTPVFTQYPSVFSALDLRVGVVTVTNNFIVFSVYVYDLEEEKKRSESGQSINGKDRTKFVLFDKSTNQFYKLRKWQYVANDIDAPENTSVNVLQSYDLLEKYNLGILKGEIKDIASKRRIDDNPVIQITKFL